MNRYGWVLVLLAALAVAAGCSSNKESVDSTKRRPPSSQSAAEPQASQMPEGHPPLPEGPPMRQPAADPHPATDSANGLIWDVPKSFEKVQPAGSMRAAEYRLPSGKERTKDGELAVFYFGAGQGGEKQANLERWANQFQQPDEGDPMKKAKIDTFQNGSLTITTIELTGHYVSSMMGGGPSYDEPGWRLFGAVVEGSGGPWFFKAVGPAEVIDGHHDALSGLLRGLRPASI